MMTPKCVALVEIMKCDISDFTNSFPFWKLALPTLPEPSIMIPTSNALVQAAEKKAFAELISECKAIGVGS